MNTQSLSRLETAKDNLKFFQQKQLHDEIKEFVKFSSFLSDAISARVFDVDKSIISLMTEAKNLTDQKISELQDEWFKRYPNAQTD